MHCNVYASFRDFLVGLLERFINRSARAISCRKSIKAGLVVVGTMQRHSSLPARAKEQSEEIKFC